MGHRGIDINFPEGEELTRWPSQQAAERGNTGRAVGSTTQKQKQTDL